MTKGVYLIASNHNAAAVQVDEKKAAVGVEQAVRHQPTAIMPSVAEPVAVQAGEPHRDTTLELIHKTPPRKVVVGKKAFFQNECIDARDVDSLDEDVVIQGVPVATVCRVLYMIEPCVQVGHLDPEITWYGC